MSQHCAVLLFGATLALGWRVIGGDPLVETVRAIAPELGTEVTVVSRRPDEDGFLDQVYAVLHGGDFIVSRCLGFRKPDSYLILTMAVADLASILVTLTNDYHWNSRARFVVAVNGQTEAGDAQRAILALLWQHYVYNVVVLVVRDNATVEASTWFPYAAENQCGATPVRRLNVLRSNPTGYFPEKVPVDLGGCRMRVIPYPAAPYIIDLHDPVNPGIEVQLMRTLATALNVRLEYVVSSGTHWGYKLPNGSYTPMYRSLFDRDGDVMVGMLLRNSSYDHDFDSTYSYYVEAAKWFVPAAGRADSWHSLLTIFERSLWLGVAFVLLLMAGAWLLAARAGEPAEFHRYAGCLLDALAMLLNLPAASTPVSATLRGLFFVWALASLHIDQAYQTKLISVLTRPGYAHQISTEPEIVAQLKYGFYPVVADVFNDPADPLHMYIANTYIRCPLTFECIERIAERRDMAVVKTRRQVLYLIPRRFTAASGRPKIYEFPGTVFSYSVRMLTVRGYPLRDRIDATIIRLHDNGLLNKFDTDVLRGPAKFLDQHDTEPLSLHSLGGLFLLLALGHGLALIIFALEHVHSRLHHLRKHTNNK